VLRATTWWIVASRPAGATPVPAGTERIAASAAMGRRASGASSPATRHPHPLFALDPCTPLPVLAAVPPFPAACGAVGSAALNLVAGLLAETPLSATPREATTSASPAGARRSSRARSTLARISHLDEVAAPSPRIRGRYGNRADLHPLPSDPRWQALRATRSPATRCGWGTESRESATRTRTGGCGRRAPRGSVVSGVRRASTGRGRARRAPRGDGEAPCGGARGCVRGRPGRAPAGLGMGSRGGARGAARGCRGERPRGWGGSLGEARVGAPVDARRGCPRGGMGSRGRRA
jgi:hypothetical protein